LLTCWTYGASFTFFQGGSNARLRLAWRAAGRNSLSLIVGAAAVVLIFYLLAAWAGFSVKPAQFVASFLTLKTRKPVKPSTILQAFNWILFVIRWIILPVMLLPMLAAIANRGWVGFREIGAFVRRWLYWIEAPLLLLCALFVPIKLLGWV